MGKRKQGTEIGDYLGIKGVPASNENTSKN
jgi:hypothetical protein